LSQAYTSLRCRSSQQIEAVYSCVWPERALLPGAAVNGFFVFCGNRTSCGTSVVMNAKPRDTSKPERGRWANPRAGRLKEVWDAVEEWLHTAEKRVCTLCTVWACYAQNPTTGSRKRLKWRGIKTHGDWQAARRGGDQRAHRPSSVLSRVGKADAVRAGLIPA
jgi:hypothetical protein